MNTLKALRWQLLILAGVAIAAALGWLDSPEGLLLGLFNFGGGSRSSSSDSRVAGTDQAVAIGGANTQAGLGENTLNVSGKSNVDLRSGIILGNTTGGVDISLTDSSPDLFRAALAAVERQSQGFSEALGGVSGQTASIIDKVLANLTDLAESKQTEGESKRDSKVLWIALGLLAVVGIYFWGRK